MYKHHITITHIQASHNYHTYTSIELLSHTNITLLSYKYKHPITITDIQASKHYHTHTSITLLSLIIHTKIHTTHYHVHIQDHITITQKQASHYYHTHTYTKLLSHIQASYKYHTCTIFYNTHACIHVDTHTYITLFTNIHVSYTCISHIIITFLSN